MMSDLEKSAGSDQTSPQSASTSANFSRLHIWQVQAFRDLLVVAVIIGVIWAGYALRFVTVPLLLAFALAYLVEPLVAWLCNVLKLSRSIAVSAILGTFGVGVVVAGLLFIPTLARQTSDFVASARAGQFDLWISRFEDILPTEYRQEVSRFRYWMGSAPVKTSPTETIHSPAKGAIPSAVATDDSASNAPSNSASNAPIESQPLVKFDAAEQESIAQLSATDSGTWMSPKAQSALGKLLDFSGLLFAAVLIPFYFWFFSVGFPSALQFLGGLVPTAHKVKIFQLASEMDAAVAGFVRGRILIAAGMGVMFAGGWWVNGVPFALTLGLLAGTLSIVPYLGAVVVIPAIALLAASQLAIPEVDRMAWYWIIGGPPLVFVIVQSIEGYILTPIFAGRATNLGPVSIFVAVLAGASVAGLYGMLLAIPVAACGKILLRETVMPSLRNWAAGRSSDPLPLNRV